MGDRIKCKSLYVLDFHNGIDIIDALNINIDDVRYIRLELMRLVVNKIYSTLHWRTSVCPWVGVSQYLWYAHFLFIFTQTKK